MMHEKNDAYLIFDDQLSQANGGTGATEEVEAYCPICGKVTKAYPVSGSLRICTVCFNKHNGERVVGLPRA